MQVQVPARADAGKQPAGFGTGELRCARGGMTSKNTAKGSGTGAGSAPSVIHSPSVSVVT